MAIHGGTVEAWLDAVLPGQRDHPSAQPSATEMASTVPCGTCTACCRSRYFIHVHHDEVAVEHIPSELLFPAPGRSNQWVMGFDERGHCPMLGEQDSSTQQTSGETRYACSIYAHRPQTCRDFDCRIFPITGTQPEEPETQLIRARTQRWQMHPPEPGSRAATLALGAYNAARFLTEHGHHIGAMAPQTSTQRAVLAVQLAPIFRDQIIPHLHASADAEHPLVSDLVTSIKTALEH